MRRGVVLLHIMRQTSRAEGSPKSTAQLTKQLRARVTVRASERSENLGACAHWLLDQAVSLVTQADGMGMFCVEPSFDISLLVLKVHHQTWLLCHPSCPCCFTGLSEADAIVMLLAAIHSRDLNRAYGGSDKPFGSSHSTTSPLKRCWSVAIAIAICGSDECQKQG